MGWARNLRTRWLAYLAGLAQSHGEPERLFWACVVGAMVGTSPLFGLHLPLCLLASRGLGLNPVVTYGAAQISMPPLVPLLASAAIRIGMALGVEVVSAPSTSPSTSTADSVTALLASPWTLGQNLFRAWLVGAPFLGAVLGAGLGAAVSKVASERLARHPGTWPFVRRQILAHYEGEAPFYRHYAQGKLRWDPLYERVWRLAETELDAGAVVWDGGGGIGLLALALAMGRPATGEPATGSPATGRPATGEPATVKRGRRVFLVESDPRKVAVATRACAGTSVNVEAADLSRGPAEAVEAALLADVLHYFPREQQQPLLRAVCDALRPGGILIVRDTDARGLGGTVTRGLEAMAMAGGWNRGAPKPDYPSLASLQRFLGETLGFTVETQSASSLLHGGNFLLVARKGRSGPAQGG